MRQGLGGRCAGVAALVAVIASGCVQQVTLLDYPDFYDPTIETVAVAPFANRTLHPMAGRYTANAVADALSANGTYHVIGPYELERRWRTGGADVSPDDRPEMIVQAVNDLNDDVDAVILGTVLAFGVDVSTYPAYAGFYPSFGVGYGYRGFGRRGYGPHYGVGAAWEPTWYHAYGVAEVAANARMLRTDTGEVLRLARESSASRESSWRYARTGRVMQEAVQILAAEMVDAFAIAPVEVEIDPEKALRTARPNGAETRRFTDTFGSGDDTMIAIVQLPLVAARNLVRLTVTRVETDTQVAERVVTWPEDQTEMIFRFDLWDLTGGQPGDFRLRLLTGDQTVAEQTIHVY